MTKRHRAVETTGSSPAAALAVAPTAGAVSALTSTGAKVTASARRPARRPTGGGVPAEAAKCRISIAMTSERLNGAPDTLAPVHEPACRPVLNSHLCSADPARG
jgi:hypothetical protein